MTCQQTDAAGLITQVRRGVNGQVITPDDPEYAEASLVEASPVDVRPVAVVRVRDTADVQAVVNLAREAGVALAVRGGGHSAAAHGTIHDGLVRDTSGLKGWQIDAEARTARAGAGLTAGEFVRAAGEHGLATGFGDTAVVGISGITLGGGLGLLSRRYGMTIDALLGAEVVTADGQVREVDADHELTTIVTIMPCPPVPFVPAEHHGAPVLFTTGVYVGAPEAAEEALAPFRALTTPLADQIRPAPYADLLG